MPDPGQQEPPRNYFANPPPQDPAPGAPDDEQAPAMDAPSDEQGPQGVDAPNVGQAPPAPQEGPAVNPAQQEPDSPSLVQWMREQDERDKEMFDQMDAIVGQWKYQCKYVVN